MNGQWNLVLFKTRDEARLLSCIEFLSRFSLGPKFYSIRMTDNASRGPGGYSPIHLFELSRAYREDLNIPSISYTDARIDTFEDVWIHSEEPFGMITGLHWEGSDAFLNHQFLFRLYDAIKAILDKNPEIPIDKEWLDYERTFLAERKEIDLTLFEGKNRDEILDENTGTVKQKLESFLAEDLTQCRVKVCADKYKTYSQDSVNEDGIRNWLRQFGTGNRAHLALKILENIHFLSKPSMGALYQRQYFLIPEELRRNARICDLGHGGESSASMDYIIAKKCINPLEAPEKFTPSIEAALDELRTEDKPTIVFVDDVVMSGKQVAEETFLELFSGFDRIPAAERKHYDKPLSSVQLQTFRRAHVVILACLATEEGRDRIARFLRPYCASCEVRAKDDTSGKCFDEDKISEIWTDDLERRMAKTMCHNLGFHLYGDKDDWDVQKKRERSLGYGDRQKLIICVHNVPTCTLPILWKTIDSPTFAWKPIFPRAEDLR